MDNKDRSVLDMTKFEFAVLSALQSPYISKDMGADYVAEQAVRLALAAFKRLEQEDVES